MTISRSQVETDFGRAQRMAEQGRIDDALDLIYDRVDELMKAGRFPQLDAMVAGVDAEDVTADVMLGILTATLPVKSRLISRAGFYRDVETTLKDRGEYETRLLDGLE